MKPNWLFLFFLAGMLGLTPLAQAEQDTLPETGRDRGLTFKQEVVKGALQGLKTAVELWRDKDFPALYEWGTAESRHLFPKERFIKLMMESNRQLQCCWAALQDLQGFFKSPTQVYVEAKLGYENFQGAPQTTSEQDPGPSQWVVSTSFDPRNFLLVLQQGKWRIDLTEVLLASGYLSEGFKAGGE